MKIISSLCYTILSIIHQIKNCLTRQGFPTGGVCVKLYQISGHTLKLLDSKICWVNTDITERIQMCPVIELQIKDTFLAVIVYVAPFGYCRTAVAAPHHP